MNDKKIDSSGDATDRFADETEAHLRRWGSGPVDPNAPIAAAMAARVMGSTMDKFVRACDEKLSCILNPSERVKALLFWIERDKKDPVMYTDFVLDLIARGKIVSGHSFVLRDSKPEVDPEFEEMTPEDMINEEFYSVEDIMGEALAYIHAMGLEDHFLNKLRSVISKNEAEKKAEKRVLGPEALEKLDKEIVRTEARIAAIRAGALQDTKDPRDLTRE